LPKIVLHQWAMSPFCNKTRRCLKHKGLTYDVVNYNGLRARKAAALSAAGQLSVLDYDGERIQDSAAIALFLDSKHPEARLYPSDQDTLARVRLWEDWAATSLYFYEIYFRMLDPVSLERALDLICEGRPRWERSILKLVFQRRYPRKLKQQGLGRLSRSQVELQFFSLLDALDKLLERRAWLAGDGVSIADFSVAAQIDELVRTSELAPQVLSRARLKEWLARC
jgi:glutathione S-transferase